MITGKYTVGYDACTFGEDGKLIEKIRTLKTLEVPSSSESSDEASYIRDDGQTGYGKYQILSAPIEKCTSLIVTVRISELNSGNIDKWGLYIRDLNGTWSRVGAINVTEDDVGHKYSHQGTQVIKFSSPQTFDAYVCFCESLGSSWNFSFTQELSNIKVVTFSR